MVTQILFLVENFLRRQYQFDAFFCYAYSRLYSKSNKQILSSIDKFLRPFRLTSRDWTMPISAKSVASKLQNFGLSGFLIKGHIQRIF